MDSNYILVDQLVNINENLGRIAECLEKLTKDIDE